MVCGDGKRVDALDIDAFMRTLANLKELEAISKQVKNLFIVNLHIRALNNDLIGRSFDILEQILQEPRKYTPGLRVDVLNDVGQNTQNRISFPGAGLTICEDAAVVSLG